MKFNRFKMLIFTIGVSLFVVLCACSTTVTPVYLLRHAEKANQPTPDPDLAPAGHARAQELKRILKEVPVAAVYTTDYKRTRQTVAPLAADKGLAPIQYDVGTVPTSILSDYVSKPTVIVGHSNTVDDLISGLGGPPFQDLPGNQYDNLLLLIIKKEKKLGSGTSTSAKLLHMKYGQQSN